MTKKELGKLVEYFFGKEGDDNSNLKNCLTNNVKFRINGCKKNFFNEKFGTTISCSQYDSVISGEGSEDKKIDSFYSSSLQSLLFFCGVSETNPLTYENVKYTKVYFEWENPVIGYPSSIDVVLVGKKDGKADGKTVVLFIESKLYETIRDSNTKSEKKSFVIGKSYFSNSEKGYGKLGLESDTDLEEIGIFQDRTTGKGYVEPIKSDAGQEKNEFVYPGGIKQELSHIIGILNFMDDPAGRKKYNTNALASDPLEEDYEIRFLTLINAMPGYSETNAELKIKAFYNHYNKVIEKLKQIAREQKAGKKSLLNLDRITLEKCMTYQTFCKRIKGYTLPTDVKRYYHLEEKAFDSDYKKM